MELTVFGNNATCPEAGGACACYLVEAAGKKILLDGLESLTAALSENTVVRKIREKGNVDLLRLAMEMTLEPVVHGKRIV